MLQAEIFRFCHTELPDDYYTTIILFFQHLRKIIVLNTCAKLLFLQALVVIYDLLSFFINNIQKSQIFELCSEPSLILIRDCIALYPFIYYHSVYFSSELKAYGDRR